MALTVWLDSLQQTQAGDGSMLVAALKQAQVTVQPPGAARVRPSGSDPGTNPWFEQ